jgi:hypothetical protein
LGRVVYDNRTFTSSIGKWHKMSQRGCTDVEDGAYWRSMTKVRVPGLVDLSHC